MPDGVSPAEAENLQKALQVLKMAELPADADVLAASVRNELLAGADGTRIVEARTTLLAYLGRRQEAAVAALG